MDVRLGGIKTQTASRRTVKEGSFTHVGGVHPVAVSNDRISIIGCCGIGERAPVPGLRQPDRSLGCCFHSVSRRKKRDVPHRIKDRQRRRGIGGIWTEVRRSIGRSDQTKERVVVVRGGAFICAVFPPLLSGRLNRTCCYS